MTLYQTSIGERKPHLFIGHLLKKAIQLLLPLFKMNVDQILNYKEDPDEDYYALLGCDPSSTTEQVVAEFKARAKEYHPDKNALHSGRQEHFKKLLKAKETLTDASSRSRYDAWRSSGLAMSFQQWMSLKDSVQTSLHWSTPKTSGRMLEQEPISLNPSPVKEEDMEKVTIMADQEEVGINYEPTPYEKLGLRVTTPPPDWNLAKPVEKKKSIEEEEVEEVVVESVDKSTAMRRKQFASRRESTIGAMVMAEKLEDNEIRRRFRNYEI